jgi:chemotaxis protein methyltransferase CheR
VTGGRRGDTLQLFARFLAREIGLHFCAERLPELGAKMASLAQEEGFSDPNAYLCRLMSGALAPEQVDKLARTLTIGETYFLRDPKSYQILEEQLLPALIAARRKTDRTLRIWSAGCSSGEEPYSLAILLSRALPDIADWRISLLGTDLNPQALERARAGVYGQWSFRNAPDWLMGYFRRREDGSFEILPQIRELVRFSQLNLADERAAARCEGTDRLDIIFCRNVMLYFDTAQIEKTMAIFHACLRDQGWLFVGPTEIDHSNFQGFSCRQYEGAFVLSKGAEEPQQSRSLWCESLLYEEEAAAPVKDRAAELPIEPPPAPALAKSAALAPSAPGDEPTAAPRSSTRTGYAEVLAKYEAGHYQQAVELALGCHDAGEEQGEVWALGARALANLGQFDEAQRCCEKAIACDRLSAHNHYLLSIILEQQGDLTGAASSLKHALYIDHDYLLAYFALGNLSRQCGDLKEAQRNFANALRLLERRDPREVLQEAEGMTAGRLAEMIRALVTKKSGQESSWCRSR